MLVGELRLPTAPQVLPHAPILLAFVPKRVLVSRAGVPTDLRSLERVSLGFRNALKKEAANMAINADGIARQGAFLFCLSQLFLGIDRVFRMSRLFLISQKVPICA
jgi:hypothetical protein